MSGSYSTTWSVSVAEEGTASPDRPWTFTLPSFFQALRLAASRSACSFLSRGKREKAEHTPCSARPSRARKGRPGAWDVPKPGRGPRERAQHPRLAPTPHPERPRRAGAHVERCEP